MNADFLILPQEPGRLHNGFHGLKIPHVSGEQEIHPVRFLLHCGKLPEQLLGILGQIPDFPGVHAQGLLKIGQKPRRRNHDLVRPPVDSPGDSQKHPVQRGALSDAPQQQAFGPQVQAVEHALFSVALCPAKSRLGHHHRRKLVDEYHVKFLPAPAQVPPGGNHIAVIIQKPIERPFFPGNGGASVHPNAGEHLVRPGALFIAGVHHPLGVVGRSRDHRHTVPLLHQRLADIRQPEGLRVIVLTHHQHIHWLSSAYFRLLFLLLPRPESKPGACPDSAPRPAGQRPRSA